MDKNEAQGIKISLYGALFLAILGISFSLITGSQAVLLDGVFNCIAVFTAWFALKISRMMEEPFSERLPVGYVAFEPFYILIKGLIVFGLSATVMTTSMLTLLSGGNELKFGVVLIYIGIASIANITIYLVIKTRAKTSTSPMLILEKENWLINMLVTLSIAASFVLVILLKDGVLKPVTVYIDQIIVIAVVLISIPVPIKAIRSGFKELMLFGVDRPLYNKIRELIRSATAPFPEENQKIFVVKTGRKYWISLFINPSGATIKTTLPDEIKDRIVKDLEKDFPIHNVDVIVTTDIGSG
ncbi:MAG: cation transporter [Cytophagales bacterium]|nr:cation transporter [Cytophagales bacterium]